MMDWDRKSDQKPFKRRFKRYLIIDQNGEGKEWWEGKKEFHLHASWPTFQKSIFYFEKKEHFRIEILRNFGLFLSHWPSSQVYWLLKLFFLERSKGKSCKKRHGPNSIHFMTAYKLSAPRFMSLKKRLVLIWIL